MSEAMTLWCASCARPIQIALPFAPVSNGVRFRTRLPRPCDGCGGLDYSNVKRVILTAADRRLLRTMEIAWGNDEVRS